MARVSALSCLIVCLLVCAASVPAIAQQLAPPSSAGSFDVPPPSGSEIAGPHYRALARKALSKPRNFDFMKLRIYYARTAQYDPLSETAVEWLMKYSYAAQTETDPAKREEALESYAALVGDHMANLEVINHALALSRADRSFGDPSFFEWARKGIIKSIVGSGDGATLAGAYDVITMGEEAALLGALNVEVLSSKTAREGAVHYNMHEVRDDRHAGPYTVFVDISIPMEELERRSETSFRGNIPNIPRR